MPEEITPSEPRTATIGVRTAQIPDPDHGKVPAVELSIQDEVEGHGATVYLLWEPARELMDALDRAARDARDDVFSFEDWRDE